LYLPIFDTGVDEIRESDVPTGNVERVCSVLYPEEDAIIKNRTVSCIYFLISLGDE